MPNFPTSLESINHRLPCATDKRGSWTCKPGPSQIMLTFPSTAAASCLHFDIFSFHLQQTGAPSIARVSHPARPVCCKVKIGLPWIHQCR